MNQAADSHCLQIVLGGNFEAGLQPGNLPLIRKLVHLPAFDQRFENCRGFRGDDGANYRTVWKIGQLCFGNLHAERSNSGERFGEIRPRGGLGPLIEIHRREAYLDLLQVARKRRCVVEALAGGCRIFGIGAGDFVQHQATIFSRPAQRSNLVQRPGKRHRTVTAHQPIGGPKAGDSTKGGGRENRSGRFRAKRKCH